MNKLRTLVILTPGFPASENDTTCLPLQQQLLLAFKRLDPSLQIIVLSFQYPYHTKGYNWNGIRVIPYSGKNKGGLTRLLLRKKVDQTLEEINRTNRIDGLLSFWYGECALAGKRFAIKHTVPHFCWILGQDARKDNKSVMRGKPEPNELVALSDIINDEFDKNYGIRPAHIIPPGIEPLADATLTQERDIHMIGVGSLVELKQYDLFLAIAAYLRTAFPDLKAVIVGEGKERERLTKLIIDWNLQRNVMLTGELSYPQVMALMKRSKILLHPSNYEGFGMVCLEALNAGAKVVSFINPMKIDIDNWYIAVNSEDMKLRVRELLLDMNMTHSGVVPFTIDNTAEKFLSLFNDN